MKIHYCEEDKALNEREFIRFANQVWPGDYDEEKTKAALKRTINMTARDGETLVGCLLFPLNSLYQAREEERTRFSPLLVTVDLCKGIGPQSCPSTQLQNSLRETILDRNSILHIRFTLKHQNKRFERIKSCPLFPCGGGFKQKRRNRCPLSCPRSVRSFAPVKLSNKDFRTFVCADLFVMI